MTTVLYTLMIANRLLPSASADQELDVCRSGYRSVASVTSHDA